MLEYGLSVLVRRESKLGVGAEIAGSEKFVCHGGRSFQRYDRRRDVTGGRRQDQRISSLIAGEKVATGVSSEKIVHTIRSQKPRSGAAVRPALVGLHELLAHQKSGKPRVS